MNSVANDILEPFVASVLFGGFWAGGWLGCTVTNSQVLKLWLSVVPSV